MSKKYGSKEMDGDYQMNRFKFRSVKEWFVWAYVRQKSSKPICTELAHFSDEKLDRISILIKSADILHELIRLCELEGILEEFMPMMVVPLKYTKKITTFDPKNFILSDELDDEP